MAEAVEDQEAMSLEDDFFSGIPIAVEAELIDKELSRLWKPAPDPTPATAAQPGRSQGGPAGAAPTLHVTRACISNLIFLALNPADAKRALELAREVGRRFPSRVILLTQGDHEPSGPPLRAWVTALCHVSSPDSAPVCCEQILLAAKPGSTEVLAGAVLPLLVPDVPVLLVLPPGCDEQTAVLLEGLADRIIFDSRPAPLSALEIPRRALGRACLPGDDLAWRVSLPWRTALCDIFDEPMARPMLPAIRRIEIEYEAPGSADGGFPGAEPRFPGAAPAALLAGWFADRLGWTFRDGAAKAGVLSATFARGDDRLAVSLRPRERPGSPEGGIQGPAGRIDGPPGQISTMRLSSDGGTFIEIHAQTDARVLEIGYRTPTACVLPRRMPLPRPTEADLLGSALERVTDQGVLRGALEMAARLLR